MKMQSAPCSRPRSTNGISAAMLLGALALTSVVDGLEVSVTATAAPIAETRSLRSRRAMCDECGVVTTSRRMATDVTQYEVAVRMRDGSIRTFIETSSVHWHSGERIIVIDAERPSFN